MNKDNHIKEQTKERFLQHIGNVIRSYRSRNSIDRHTLASALGCDDSTVSRYEHGSSDIKASTMAYISVLCNFPMYKYTEIYNKEPAAVVEDFRKLVRISAPVKRRKANSDTGNKPPRPRLVFDDKKWEWTMQEIVPVDYDVINNDAAFVIEQSESYFADYILQQEDKAKLSLLIHLSEIVDKETDGGNKKCPGELKTLIRSSIKYISSDKNRNTQKRLKAYCNALSEIYKNEKRPQ